MLVTKTNNAEIRSWYKSKRREYREENVLKQFPLHEAQLTFPADHRVHHSGYEYTQSREANRTHQTDDGFQVWYESSHTDSGRYNHGPYGDLGQVVVFLWNPVD